MYNEEDLNENPYTEITQLEDGRIRIETDK